MKSLRSLSLTAALIAFVSLPTTAAAQQAGTVELGAFGHFTKLDSEVALGDKSFGLGGRLGFFALRWLAIEAEYGFGTLDDNIRDASLWLPFRGMVVFNVPVTSRAKLLLGAGYKMDTWKGDTTANEFEDAMSLLGGIRICLNNGWSLRPEIVYDRNPSPNFQNSVDATSSHLGFRFGISKFFGRGNETCERLGSVPPPPPPAVMPPPAAPPPAVVVPPPAPPPAPTVNLSASPSTIVAGSSAMLIWTSTNAQRCSAPWTQSTTSSGSQSVSPATTTSYTITCTGAGGTANAPVTVNVTAPPAAPPPPPAAPAPRVLFRLEGVNFDVDRATIKPEGRVKLDSAVTLLRNMPDIRVEIQGHTDSTGSAEYNEGLSLRRANAVREYLVSNGIAASRLTTRGFGESQPAADNRTAAGRAQNRRVLLVEVRN